MLPCVIYFHSLIDHVRLPVGVFSSNFVPKLCRFLGCVQKVIAITCVITVIFQVKLGYPDPLGFFLHMFQKNPSTIYGTEWPIMCWCAVKKLLTHCRRTFGMSGTGIHGINVFPVTQPTTNSVKALKEAQSTDLSQWPGLMLLHSPTGKGNGLREQFIMAAPWNRQHIIFLPCGFYLLSSFFFFIA